jgi:integrase
MSSVSIRRRETSFQVRFRRGGRAYPLVHAGSFKTLKEARLRRDLVAGELAAGRNPADALGALSAPPTRRTFREWAKAYEASRVDLSVNAHKALRSHLPRILSTFGETDPQTITAAAVQEWVAANSDLKPASLSRYLATFRLLLDFAGTEPNPARDRRVRLPRIEQAVVEPPTAEQVEAILDRVGDRWCLPLRTLEQSGMRVGELSQLEWRDVDVAGSRFRIRHGKTKTARRWVAVPAWLMLEIQATCPLEDRTGERRVFPRFTVDGAEKAMKNACKLAEIPRYSPHDLRHRYASLKLREGVPVTDLAAQLGHARKSMTLDTYSHVLIDN